MRLSRVFGTGLIVAALAAGGARAADAPEPALSGDQILQRAASSDNLASYSVPVTFQVHLRRPVGARARVEGMVYFKAPARAALVITKAPGLIGGFFKGAYTLDMIPQTWPSQYQVQSVSTGQAGAASAYILTATPRKNPDIDHVVFTVTQADFVPVAAVWYYRTKSSIKLSITSGQVSTFTLPHADAITVEMPKYALDATGKYGEYALNAPVSDSVFSNSK
jgi:hypothetical protein